MPFTPATSQVTLSRHGAVLFVQPQRLTNAAGTSVRISRIIIEESRGAGADACRHWLDEYLRSSKSAMADHLRERRKEFDRTTSALRGDNPIGFFSVKRLRKGEYVQLLFHTTEPRLTCAFVGTCNLGLIKAIEPQSPKALPRTKRRRLHS